MHRPPRSNGGGISKVNIPTDLHQRVTGRPYTIAQFFREAVAGQLAVIARDYNHGRDILPDSSPLEPGQKS